MMEDADAAITVRCASKTYNQKEGKMVLDNLDMTVKKGHIYGLLGASGCGKTTLLSAIVGCRTIQSGEIRILGELPDTTMMKHIGYMPQDIALVGEFTVKGAVQHFGWIFGMSDELIDQRFEFLEKLLDLPPADRYVKNCSGGQQRRISLAVVLIHDPQILILDEPTVGLDPVLRETIWKYLKKMADEEKKTVIITTHYIEEARQAHSIGMMRGGKILAEGDPSFLLSKYGCSTLEDVFLLLSRKQQERQLQDQHNSDTQEITTLDRVNTSDRTDSSNRNSNNVTAHSKPKFTLRSLLFETNKGHAKALLSKNFLKILRHPGGLCFAFLFPFLQVSIFYLAIGVMPNDLTIGVVNEEMGNYTDCAQYALYNHIGGTRSPDNTSRECIFEGLGCRFVNSVRGPVKVKKYYSTRDEAQNDVEAGRIRLYLHFPKNFSDAVTLVKDGWKEITDEDLDFQQVNVVRESMDYTLNIHIEREIYEAYTRFAKSLAADCNENERAETPPIIFNDPIYGWSNMTYNEALAPGILTTITVFLAMSISTLVMITERIEGVWDRTIVSGVSTTEILVFHIITQCVIVFLQLTECFVLSFYVYNSPCIGSKLTVLGIVYSQGFMGICFGILISIVSRNVTESNYLSLGSFYPIIIMSGYLWPMESMPLILRWIATFVPTTIPIESMGHVVYRGWTVYEFSVYKAFLTTGFWTAIIIVSSAFLLKREIKV